MRVLHVITGLDRRHGGPPAALAGLAAAQARAGLDVEIFAVQRAGEGDGLAQELPPAGVSVRTVGPAQGPLARHRSLKAVLGEVVAQADVVHIHGLWEEVQHQAARAARKSGRAYLFTPHGMLDPWSLARKALKKRLYLAWRLRRDLDGAAALHLASAAERDAVAAMQLKPRPIVEAMGVDLTAFQHPPEPGAFRRRFPNVARRSIVLFLGRIHPGKGLEYLIPAFARLRNREAALVAVGPDSRCHRARLEADVARLGLQGRVVFTGMLTGADRLAALADADLFCLPSDHENFGLSVIEALAAGTPVLVSDRVSMHREIVEAGVGDVVPREPASLADAIDRWLDDVALRREAAARARAFVRERYDWDVIARRWVGRYDEVRSR